METESSVRSETAMFRALNDLETTYAYASHGHGLAEALLQLKQKEVYV